MRKKPATTGRPKAQSRRLSEVGNVPPSESRGAKTPAGAAASKTLAASGPKSLMKTSELGAGRGTQRRLGSQSASKSDIASDAPPQAGAIQDLEQPATEN